MDFGPLLPGAQLVTTGGAVVVLLWVIKALTGVDGVLVPRWIHDRETKRADDAERRADRTLDLSEAVLSREEKKRR